MIILDNLGYLLMIGFSVFVLTLFTKLFIRVKNVSYSFKGVLYFMFFTFTYPFLVSNEFYQKRKALVRKITKEKSLTSKQKVKLKRLVNSRVRLYFTVGLNHVLEFPSFIESFSIAFERWYRKKNFSASKKTMNPLKEIFKIDLGKFPDIFNTLKEKLS